MLLVILITAVACDVYDDNIVTLQLNGNIPNNVLFYYCLLFNKASFKVN